MGEYFGSAALFYDVSSFTVKIFSTQYDYSQRYNITFREIYPPRVYPDGSIHTMLADDFENRYAVIRITQPGEYFIKAKSEGQPVPYILRSLPENREQTAMSEETESNANRFEMTAGDYLFSLIVEPFIGNVSLCVSEEDSFCKPF